MKKHIVEALEQFVIDRINRFVYEQNLKKDYSDKAKQIEDIFVNRISHLLDSVNKV